MGRQTFEQVFHFRGHQKFPLTASGVGPPWTKADTSSAGSPTIQGLDGGGIRMAFDNTSEIQNLCLYFGDVLAYDIDDLIRAWFIVKTVAALTATNTISFGLASARNDAIASLSACALFQLAGSNSLTIRTTDGTTTKNAIATGQTVKTAWKRLEMNFAERNTTLEPPSVSLGRKSNVGFYASNDAGPSLRRVASGTRFDMSAYTAGLQPYFQFQKTADTNTDTFDILACGFEFNLPQ